MNKIYTRTKYVNVQNRQGKTKNYKKFKITMKNVITSQNKQVVIQKSKNAKLKIRTIQTPTKIYNL